MTIIISYRNTKPNRKTMSYSVLFYYWVDTSIIPKGIIHLVVRCFGTDVIYLCMFIVENYIC